MGRHAQTGVPIRKFGVAAVGVRRRYWACMAAIVQASQLLSASHHHWTGVDMRAGGIITRKIPLAQQRLNEMLKKYLAVNYDCYICIFKHVLSFRDLRFWETGNRDVLLSALHRFISREFFNNSLQSRISHSNMHAWRNCERRPMQHALHSPQGKHSRLLR